LLVALLLVALALPASSGTAPRLKTVRSGAFTMGVPVAWKARTNVGAIRVIATAPKPAAGFLTNVNVVTGTPRGSLSVSVWRALIADQLSRLGLGVSSPRTRLVALPGGRALEIRYAGTFAGHKLRWLAYAFDAGRRSFVVTFTTSATAYGGQAALFRSMARSVRIRR
jgi:hypothetical protein